MDLAFLIALLLCVALAVYALRVAADRDRWRDEAELQGTVVLTYGNDWTHESLRQRRIRARDVVDKARGARKRK